MSLSPPGPEPVPNSAQRPEETSGVSPAARTLHSPFADLMASPLDQTPPPVPPAPFDPTGTEIDGYKILRLLGQGGMGQVFMAEQSSLRRMVALKLIRPEALTSATAIKRFQLEAEAIARINHPGIVQVYAVGQSKGLPYMALEYVPGRTLKDLLLRKGTLSEQAAISILLQVAKALDRANEAGVIHRDIKPENILLTRKGQAKVADFGLARFRDPGTKTLNLTQEGLTLGTPLYMSPEQVEGRPLDIRTDIYSLGVTAYHMLAGHPPYQGKNQLEVALLHVQGRARPLHSLRPDLTSGLTSIVQRMMSRKPEYRHQSPAELIADLQKVSRGLPPAPDPGLPLWFQWAPRLVPWFVLASCALATLALGRTYFHGPDPNDIDLSQDLLVEEVLASNSAGKRETVLRDAARGYIQGTGTGSPNTGLALCVDLGILYLNQGHWDEAISFFKECENEKADSSYQALGKLGLGIVYAMKNQPNESVAAFKALTKPELRDRITRGVLRQALDRKSGINAKKNAKAAERFKGDSRAEQGTMLRFWLSEAIYYNKRNGKAENEIPPFLRNLIPEAAKAEKG